MIFLALGSSIGNAETIFASAKKFLEKEGVKVLQKSDILKNPPFGGVAKNEFSNAVWEIELASNFENSEIPKVEKLLQICKQCEAEHGRDFEKEKWADRPLDLDILMFNDLISEQKDLKIPHSEIPNRIFVLLPWSEIVPSDFEIPVYGNLQNLLKKLNKTQQTLKQNPGH